MKEFFKEQYSSDEIVQLIKTKKEKFWLKEREKRMFKIFKSAAKNIPAYRDFLRKNNIDYKKIKNYESFKTVPAINKKNYLKEYPLKKICWEGMLEKPMVYTSTSGSTGTPFYFPREEKLDWQCSVIKNLFMHNSCLNKEGSSLVVICFGMGVWIAGLITYKAFEIISHNGHPVSIITPGINKLEIFNALKNLSPNYKQTILIGYPPFIKDIIDEAPERGVNLKKMNVRLLFAAESFTEKFRNYIVKKVGIKNMYLDTLNIYGSADIGAMAFETPLSILVRRVAVRNKELFRDIFSGINKTPTLAQYIPLFINFEAENGELMLTGDNAIPLIRYSIGDNGGVLNFSEIKDKFKRHGFNIYKEARKAGIKDHIYELPFVYVYERADFSTSLYGALIYPEPVKEAIQDRSFDNFLTGKFSLVTKYSEKNNQYLEINIEMQKNKKSNNSLRRKATAKIYKVLREKISEFREISDHIKDRTLLKLVFWPAEHPEYFKPGVKQRWVVKEIKN